MKTECNTVNTPLLKYLFAQLLTMKRIIRKNTHSSYQLLHLLFLLICNYYSYFH